MDPLRYHSETVRMWIAAVLVGCGVLILPRHIRTRFMREMGLDIRDRAAWRADPLESPPANRSGGAG